MTLRTARWRTLFVPIFQAIAKSLRAWDGILYLLICGAAVLGVACLFYSSLRLQTLYARLWSDPAAFDWVSQHAVPGDWSAPLDDVFIHFDFARATARGYPFEWLEGNGYSSGGTSLLYPFVLAFGYWVCFRGLDLMVWAGIVACVSVFALLIAARRLFDGLPRWTAYLAPLFLLGIGVLNWTLFSGMEVALFLALWGGAFTLWAELVECNTPAELTGRALWLGGAGLLLVATRPEAAPTVAIFSLSASYPVFKRRDYRAALKVLLATALPGAGLVIAQAVANRLLTGDFTAAGALAKLEAHHPYLTKTEVWNAWLFHIEYQVRRVTEYHLSVIPWLGWCLWGFAALAVVFPQTRRNALLLWATALCWVLVVALNGQVRWQNERYTMPALAWLLLLAALGFAGLLSQRYRHVSLRVATGGLAGATLALFAYFQAPRFRDQVWFFGRASRNILDQHVATGKFIRQVLKPTPKRILLSDAGAIPYAADLPALDLIGLGGFMRLPFARATRLGEAGGIELIEHVPPDLRPDVFALYPSWWHTFPLWFGTRLDEVPVRGNVICGGASKVLYRADFSPLAMSGHPFAPGSKQGLVDSLDLADVLSEHAHRFELEQEATGHLTMKLLADPRDRRRGLWDGGRLFAPGTTARFSIAGLASDRSFTLWFRVAPADDASIDVEIDGAPAQSLTLAPSDGWLELPMKIDPKQRKNSYDVRLVPRAGGSELYHIWVTQLR